MSATFGLHTDQLCRGQRWMTSAQWPIAHWVGINMFHMPSAKCWHQKKKQQGSMVYALKIQLVRVFDHSVTCWMAMVVIWSLFITRMLMHTTSRRVILCTVVIGGFAIGCWAVLYILNSTVSCMRLSVLQTVPVVACTSWRTLSVSMLALWVCTQILNLTSHTLYPADVAMYAQHIQGFVCQ